MSTKTIYCPQHMSIELVDQLIALFSEFMPVTRTNDMEQADIKIRQSFDDFSSIYSEDILLIVTKYKPGEGQRIIFCSTHKCTYHPHIYDEFIKVDSWTDLKLDVNKKRIIKYFL